MCLPSFVIPAQAGTQQQKHHSLVIPAQAGIQLGNQKVWTPACAGVTKWERVARSARMKERQTIKFLVDIHKFRRNIW